MELIVSCVGMGFADKKEAIALMKEHLNDEYEEFISHFTFVHDADNEYDSNAVAILWHPNIDGREPLDNPIDWTRNQIVGFVPRDEQEAFFDFIQQVSRIRVDLAHIQYHAKQGDKIISMQLKVSKI